MIRAVDLFAGMGGFTEGASRAGIKVVWAADHWQLAVDIHARNHPGTEHVCQDLRQADWRRVPSYDLLLAAPACQGHSQAAQGPRRPAHHDALRATAWAVVDCAEATEPRTIVVENVPRFKAWRLYPVWRDAIHRLGYRTTELELVASHHGVPQRRTRFFFIATKRAKAFEFERPRSYIEPAFGECIDWTAPGWKPITAARPAARDRILAAQARRGPRCLVQHVTGHPGVPLEEPIRTITAKDQWVLVDGKRYRWLQMRELARGQSFSDSYYWPEGASRADTVRGIGNAVPPLLAEAILRQVAA